MPDQPQSVQFRYLKSNFFRVAHIDGVIGGITPTRGIFVSLYHQRSAIPDVTEQALLPDGTLGEESVIEAQRELVREVEVGLVMSSETAEVLARFLTERVTLLRELGRDWEKTDEQRQSGS